MRADPPVRVLPLDVTDDTSVQVAAVAASDVSVIVNNAGVHNFGGALDRDLAGQEQDMVTNYSAPLRVTRAFVPMPA